VDREAHRETPVAVLHFGIGRKYGGSVQVKGWARADEVSSADSCRWQQL